VQIRLPSATWALEWLDTLPPRDQRKFVAVLLHAYLDESGIHGARHCIVAGYLASARQWGTFIKKCEEIAVRFDAPVFHARRFFSVPAFKNEYAEWSISKRNHYIDEVIQSIRRQRLTPIAMAVDVEGFSQLNENKRRWLTGGTRELTNLKWQKQGAPTKPYFPCFMRCLSGIVRLTNPGLLTHVYS
jgi:hypothetical protein